MTECSKILLSMSYNFRKWKTNPRIYIILVILVIYHFYTFRRYVQIASFLGMSVSICVFPFFFALPLMAFICGALPMLLYSEAPFTDYYAPFFVIRSGKRNWIIGQILYILLSSFIYTLVSALISILVLIPRVSFELDWGEALWTMAQNPQLAQQVGTAVIMPGEELMNAMSGGMALLYSVLLGWLVAAFLGVVILCFNVLIKKGIGMIVAGFFTGLAYFAAIFGPIIFGNAVRWFSPVSWCNLYFVKLSNDSSAPPIWYAFTVLISSILIMSIISVIAFCKKDLDFEKGEY